MLKKLLFLAITFSLVSPTLFAQWQWSIRGGSVNNLQNANQYNNINQITTDQAGNVYILGQIGGAGVKVGNQSLNGYSSVSPGASLDVVLSSFTANGSYRWSKVIGGELGDYGHSLKTDKQGHVYVMGRIDNPGETFVGVPYNAVHFDVDTILPKILIDSLGVNYLDSLQQSMFLVQYDTAGTLNWLRMPEPDTTTKYHGNLPLRMDVDNSGNIHWWCYLKPGEFR